MNYMYSIGNHKTENAFVIRFIILPGMGSVGDQGE